MQKPLFASLDKKRSGEVGASKFERNLLALPSFGSAQLLDIQESG